MNGAVVGGQGQDPAGKVPPPALELRGFAAPFGSSVGLDPIDLVVDRGETIALVGPSGAGKTSLLRAIAGLAPDAAGRLLIDGADSGHLPPEARNVVYLHQTPVLFPHLDVLENVAFALRVRGVGAEERAARARAALDTVQVGELAGRRPETLSGGQRQRVALARAVVGRPGVLLLDEPFAALDPALRDDVRRAIRAAQEATGAAMLLVTHDLDDAALLGDRVGVLLDRRLAQIAAPAELFQGPSSVAVARLIGWTNELPGRVTADGGAVTCALGQVRPGSGLADAIPGASGTLAFPDAALSTIPRSPPAPDPNPHAVEAEIASVTHRPGGISVEAWIGTTRVQMALGAGSGDTDPLPTPGEVRPLYLSGVRAVWFPA